MSSASGLDGSAEEARVKVVTTVLAARVADDPALAPLYGGPDLTVLRRRQRPFVSAALGVAPAPERAAAELAELAATAAGEAFDRLTVHLVASLADLGWSPTAVDAVRRRLASLRVAVVARVGMSSGCSPGNGSAVRTIPRGGGRVRAGATFYEELGGDAGVKTAVGIFYARVLADDELAPYFDGVDLTRLRAHQRAFLSAALGGPELFSGRDLESAHAGLGITADAFERLLDHLAATLGDLGLAPASVAAVRGHVGELRARIVG